MAGIMRGVANVTRNITQQFRGVANVTRTIVKEWRGVSNVNRVCFNTEKVYLYNSGDECTSLTGGWTNLDGYCRGEAYLRRNSDNITLHITKSGNQTITVFTENKIDLTGYTKLIAQVEYNTTSLNGLARLMIDDAVVNKADAQVAHKSIDDPYTGTLTLDVSSYNSGYYVAIQLDGWTGDKTASFKVTQIWLE